MMRTVYPGGPRFGAWDIWHPLPGNDALTRERNRKLKLLSDLFFTRMTVRDALIESGLVSAKSDWHHQVQKHLIKRLDVVDRLEITDEEARFPENLPGIIERIKQAL